MPFNMQLFVNGEYEIFHVNPEAKYACGLIQQAKFNRVNPVVNGLNYALRKNGVTYNRVVSKSGITESRVFTILPPQAKQNFPDILAYISEHDALPAVIHDGLKFIEKYQPFIKSGEIVIGFPGMTRQNCTKSYFPIIGISDKEIFLDEVSTNIGWKGHWYVGINPRLTPHRYPKPAYLT